jgi:hypothetical protein
MQVKQTVDNVLYRYAPESARERVDRFKGKMSARIGGQVELNSGKTLAVQAYAVRLKFANRLDSMECDVDEFLRTGDDRFRKSYRGHQPL